MDILEYFLLFISVFVGGGIAFYLKENKPAQLQLVLSLSGAFLIGITFLHLMPGVFSGASHEMGFWVLAGFFFQLILEQFSGGVEHGHIHAAHHSTAQFAFSVMIGLCAHAFLEGLPMSAYENLANTNIDDPHHGHNHLLYGIILHKIPAAFSLVLLFLLSGYKKWVVLLNLTIFALMSPLAALLADGIGFDFETQKRITAVVIGSFLHISTTILFELDNAKAHKISGRKMLAILVGIGLAVLTVVL